MILTIMDFFESKDVTFYEDVFPFGQSKGLENHGEQQDEFSNMRLDGFCDEDFLEKAGDKEVTQHDLAQLGKSEDRGSSTPKSGLAVPNEGSPDERDNSVLNQGLTILEEGSPDQKESFLELSAVGQQSNQERGAVQDTTGSEPPLSHALEPDPVPPEPKQTQCTQKPPASFDSYVCYNIRSKDLISYALLTSTSS